MDITPDLSHLTEDERKIIEAVINRQKAEEKRDAAVLKTSHQDDYSAPVAMVSHRSSQQIRAKPSSITESGVCCEICQKTKFVGESSARQCSICKKCFCVRCGVRLKSTKTYWLCRVCREKQERYFSSRQLMPSTSSVSQITATSNNLHRSTDETSKQISKQYVSDYILSQPFDNNDEEEIHQNHSSPVVVQRKRILPTAHIQRQQQIVNVVEPPTEDLRRNNNWQKDEILAAKLENFLSTSTTNWKWNENRTEQIGYVHLKNHNWISSIRDNDQQGKLMENDIFSALGLKIESRMIDEENSTSVTEIVEVTAGSVADHYGQLQIGDQILEWNEHPLTNLDVNEISRTIAENSLETDDIRLIVKRMHRYSTNEQSSQGNDETKSKRRQSI